jgi:hypothetical protein
MFDDLEILTDTAKRRKRKFTRIGLDDDAVFCGDARRQNNNLPRLVELARQFAERRRLRKPTGFRKSQW